MNKKSVVAEADEGGWLVMFHDGSVRWLPTQEKVLAAIRREDKRTAKETGIGVMTLVTFRDRA